MFGGIPENELADLQAYWDAFPTLKTSLFKGFGIQFSCGNLNFNPLNSDKCFASAAEGSASSESQKINTL